MTNGYRCKVYMTGVDKEQARRLRYALGDVIKGAGKVTLRQLMKRAYEGERILVYETNLDADAEGVAKLLTDNGAEVQIEGLKPPEEEF